MTKFKKRTNRLEKNLFLISVERINGINDGENERTKVIGKCLSTRINITWFIKRKYIEENEGERDCRRSFGSVTLNREVREWSPRNISPLPLLHFLSKFTTPPFTPCVCLMSNNFSTLIAWHASGHTFSSFRLLFVPFFALSFLSFFPFEIRTSF